MLRPKGRHLSAIDWRPDALLDVTAPAKALRNLPGKALQKTHQDCRSNQRCEPWPPTALCLTQLLRQVSFKLSPFWSPQS